jgi:Xaa-Pro dipeptidase
LQRLGASTLLTYKGTNRDSGLELPAPTFTGLDDADSGVTISEEGSKRFFFELGECRNIKSPEEVKILQYVNDISSVAHIEVMRAIKGGQRERLSETIFRYQAGLRGCNRVGYTCICPTGPRNAILHYGHPGEPNAELVDADALTLHDMGCEYHCYTADVTITFPVSGKFTPEQKVVYEAVWAATEAVERCIKPGICYKDMHRLAQRTLLTEMKSAGLFVGEVDDMMAIDLAGRFMPHGLGHCLGLDVHDVAGYAPGTAKSDDPNMRQNLRCGRDLIENMVTLAALNSESIGKLQGGNCANVFARCIG